LRLEPKRPGLALVSDSPAAIDQIKPIRPGRISILRSIVYRVYEGRKFDAKLGRAGSREVYSFVIILRVPVDYILSLVYRQLPFIARMCLFDVNQKEFGPILILMIEIVERGNLPAKRRSGVTAKY
jgi:hypothetical protein